MSELTRLADRLARVFDAYQLKLRVKFSRFRSKRSLRGRLHMLKYTFPMSPCVVGAGARAAAQPHRKLFLRMASCDMAFGAFGSG